jgi:hypothetical protein
MDFLKDSKKTQTSKSYIGGVASINDLREKEYSGKNLTLEEKKALVNFDNYRLNELNSQESEEGFHKKFLELQVQANLAPYTDFLSDKYSA